MASEFFRIAAPLAAMDARMSPWVGCVHSTLTILNVLWFVVMSVLYALGWHRSCDFFVRYWRWCFGIRKV